MKFKVLFPLILLNFTNKLHSQSSNLNDDTFINNSIGTNLFRGTNNYINFSIPYQDGKILLVGDVNANRVFNKEGLVRITDDGKVDTTFNCGKGANGKIFAAALQKDKKIIIVGDFDNFNGFPRKKIARLYPNGSIDESYNPQILFGEPLFDITNLSRRNNESSPITDLMINANGDLLIIGNFFNSFNNNPTQILKITEKGEIIPFRIIFNFSGRLSKIQKNIDNKFYLVENNKPNGNLKKIYRFNENGTLDKSFNFDYSKLNYFVDYLIDGNKFYTFGQNPENNLEILKFNSFGRQDNTFKFSPKNIFSKKIIIGADNKLIIFPEKEEYLTSEENFKSDENIVSINPNYPIRINLNGTIDKNFVSPYISNGKINTICQKPNKKIFIGGEYSKYGNYYLKNVCQLNPDGKIDEKIITHGPNDRISNIVIQNDNKIILSGYFSTYNSLPYFGLCRLNKDGDLDSNFIENKNRINKKIIEPISNPAILVQRDNKILVAGSMKDFTDNWQNGVIRLNNNGSIDSTFFLGTILGRGQIYQIAIQKDDKILVGGDFSLYNDEKVNILIRLNQDGNVDKTFQPQIGDREINLKNCNDIFNCPYEIIKYLRLQSDGKILVHGKFKYGETIGLNTVRLNQDGTVDTKFDSNFLSGKDLSAIQVDKNDDIIVNYYEKMERNVNFLVQKISKNGLVDSKFETIKDISTSVILIDEENKIILPKYFMNNVSINRYNPNGTLDKTYLSNSLFKREFINDIKFQGKNKLILVGSFSSFDRILKNNITRINLN